MASANLKDELSCSICLDVYTDPVTLRCGHNFCRECIDRVLDEEGTSRDYSCPECRKKFIGRPELQGNVTLRNIAERFRSSEAGGSSGVLCTYCLHAPVLAVKSCLHCEASLCPDHLRVHSKSPEHVLCEPGTALDTRKCAVHKKILEYYCSEDSSLMCVSCRLEGEHGGHHVESLDKACEKKRKQLFQLLQELTSRRSEIEKRVQSLEERKRGVHDVATAVTQTITTTFGEIRRQLEELEERVLKEVSRQEKQASLRVSDLIQELETKKDWMSKKMCHIEALCHTTDPLTVLQEQVSWQSDHEESPTVGKAKDDENQQELQDVCLDPISNTFRTLYDIAVRAARGIYRQDPTDIILDVNTSGDFISISQDLKSAAYSERKNNLPKTLERFACNQILSMQSFSSGVHYWDVEGDESGMWRVGICYSSMDRAGGHSVIGDNDRSWALEYYMNEYSAIHNGKDVSIAQEVTRHGLRICLDYEAGKLSFYQRSHPISHLHTFSTIFTEPLYAAFWVGWDPVNTDSWVKIVN